MTSSDTPPPASWPEPGAVADTSRPAAVAIERPGMVTAGAVTLIVLGAITLLFGLLFLLGGALFAGLAGSVPETAEMPGLGGMTGAFAGFFIVLALIVLLFGGLQLLAGIKTLSGRGWARILGIVLAAILGVISLLGAVGALSTPAEQGGGTVSLIINLVLLAANAFVIYALVRGGTWFQARSRALA